MDTSDESISFDDDGVCSHCHTVGATVSQALFRPDHDALLGMVEKIKFHGRNMDYDCIFRAEWWSGQFFPSSSG